ncbi:MAG: DNA polymerase III subunit beta [Proteobacteria bacterium]|nr:DNA polymerase III subunit beta [Pseudomonadota bacterium]
MISAESLPISSQEPLHVIVEKGPLLKALAHCQGVVEKRNTIPILAHVLLEAQGSTLKITATDLEISFSETFPARVNLHGSTTVSAHLLFDVVRKLPEGAEIELKTSKDGATLNLNSGRSNYNFACLPAIDFPFMTTENLSCTFKIHAAELARLIDKTRFSMSTEETRYYLNGICFHGTPDGFLRAVATDGLRLAQAQVELPPEASRMPQVIISRKTIYEIRKLIDEVADEITVSLSENQVRFTVASSVLISRLIEGKFPDYEKVIPFGNDNILEVNAKMFAETVDRISIMSTDKLRPVKMRVENVTMTISAHSSETGNAVEELEIKYSGQQPIDFGFNARYILDVTQQIQNETLQFLIGDETQAIIAKDATDSSSLYVLMPMRV